MWEIPGVKTITADDYKRVRIPTAKPGQVFAFEDNAGILTLTPVKPVEPVTRPAKVRFESGGVAVTDRPINEAAIRELLTDFP